MALDPRLELGMDLCPTKSAALPAELPERIIKITPTWIVILRGVWTPVFSGPGVPTVSAPVREITFTGNFTIYYSAIRCIYFYHIGTAAPFRFLHDCDIIKKWMWLMVLAAEHILSARLSGSHLYPATPRLPCGRGLCRRSLTCSRGLGLCRCFASLIYSDIIPYLRIFVKTIFVPLTENFRLFSLFVPPTAPW